MDTESKPQVFRYVKPEVKQGKAVTLLCRTPYLMGVVQTVKAGGETNLHAHRHMDGMWTVLSGRARFYGQGNIVLAELGRLEGILIPRGFKYWFESVGDEELELLQVDASDTPIHRMDELATERIDHSPRNPNTAKPAIYDARV